MRLGASARLLVALAYVLFIAAGGVLIFGYFQMLRPALETQEDAACRPLRPIDLDCVPPPLAGLVHADGSPFDASALEGKLVIVNFWATFCEPCTREWPALDKLAARVADQKDIVIIAVSIDKDREAIARYLERMDLQESGVIVLWDPSGSLHLQFGSDLIPDTYFLSRSGEVRRVFVSVRDWGSPAALRCTTASASERTAPSLVGAAGCAVRRALVAPSLEPPASPPAGPGAVGVPRG